MAVVIITGSQANAAGGGDVLPAAVDWNNVTVTNLSGIETTGEVTFTGINSPITVRASWTSTSSNPTKAQWLYNSAAVQSPALSSIEATIIVNGKLKWQTYCAYTHPAGNYDTGTVTVTNESKTATVTITIATPGVVSWTAHGFAAGQRILFRTTGALPTGLTAGTVYFVSATDLLTDSFKVSATDGGAVINTTGTQSGTHTGVMVLDTFTYACQYVRTLSDEEAEDTGGAVVEPPVISNPP